MVMAMSVDYRDAALPFLTCEINGRSDNFLVDSGSTFYFLHIFNYSGQVQGGVAVVF